MNKEINSQENAKRKQHAYLISSSVNILMPPIKLVAGIYGHSSALIADAINSISDVVANTVVYIFLKVSSKPRDKHHSYGHGKYETLASLFIALMMIVAAILIVAQGVATFYKFFTDGALPEMPSMVALIISLVTMVVKYLTYRYTKSMAIKTHSDALMAQAYDHKYDIFAALAVVLGVFGARLIGGTGLLLEPLAAMIVAFFIFRAGAELAKPSLMKLTDGNVPDEVIEEIRTMILEIPGIQDPHNFRTRMIGSDTMAIELDIRLDGHLSLFEAHDKTIEVEDTIREKYGEETHIIVHVEPTLPYKHVSRHVREAEKSEGIH